MRHSRHTGLSSTMTTLEASPPCIAYIDTGSGEPVVMIHLLVRHKGRMAELVRNP